MDLLHSFSLWIHVAAGMTALFVAPGAMIAKKGKMWHRRWGKIYFWCMFIVVVSAVVVASVKPNLFLLLLAVFSFYLSFSGYRVLYRKKPGTAVPLLDWVDMDGALLLGDDVADGVRVGLDGRVHYPDAPGMGITWRGLHPVDHGDHA